MRKIMAVLLSLLMVSPVLATDYTADANCVGAWLFDDGSGTTLNDSSSANHDGTINGASWSTDVPGAFVAGSLSFDGNDDYVSAADPSSITNHLTVVSYVKATSWDDADHVVSYHPGFFFSTYYSSFRFASDFSSPVSCSFGNTGDIGTGSWNHYAGVYDGAHMTSYTNGNSMVQLEETDNINTSGDFRIGNYSGGGFAFNGYITQVAVFNRALSSTEINDIMDNGLKPAGETPPAASEESHEVMGTIFEDSW